MTSESKGATEDWIQTHRADFPYAYDKGGKLGRKVGQRSYPHAVLINPLGEIVWSGHPNRASAALIKPHLASSLQKPLYSWPKEAKKVAAPLGKRSFAKAMAEAVKLGDPEITDMVQAQIDLRASTVKVLRNEGDWLAVETRGKAYAKQLKGLPESEELEAILDELAKDKPAQAVIKGQEAVAKLTAGKIKAKQVSKLKDKLEKLRGEHRGTIVERDVQRAIEKLNAIERK